MTLPRLHLPRSLPGALIVSAAACILPGPALAEEMETAPTKLDHAEDQAEEQVPAESGQDPHRARAEYQRGNAAFRSAHFTRARHHYENALAAEATFDILCNLGRTDAKLGDYVSAYEHLTRCVQAYPRDAELSGSRQRFVDLRDEVRAHLSDDQVALAEGRIARAEAPSESRAGSAAPDEEAVARSAETESPPSVARRTPARLPVSAAIGGLGVVALGVGTGLLVHSGSLSGDADALRDELSGVDCAASTPEPRCTELLDTVASSDSAQNAGVATLATGGALLVGAVVTYLLWPSPQTGSAAVEAPGRALSASSPRGLRARPFATVDPARESFSLGFSGSF